jgi:protein transport protein SEC31
MVKLKEIPRTATFAWSPNAGEPLMVSGTVAGAIDEDFSSTTQLELWELSLIDHSPDGLQLKPRVSIDTDAR